MTRQRFVTYAATFALAGLPLSGVAWAQDRTSNGNTTGTAVPRGDGGGGGTAAPRDGGGSSAGSVGSSSGGSSGDAGGMSSGWSSPSSGSSSMPAMGSGFDAPRRANDQAVRSRSGGSSTGSAVPRGGSSSTRSGGDASSASSGANDSGSSRRAVPAYSRPRDGRQVTGEATERGTFAGGGGGGGINYPYYPYYPWGFWGPGYGFGLGYLYYDPWFSGYGFGYGDSFGFGGGGGGGGGYSVSQSYRDSGSLRLKINPKEAQIFVDGYFVGVVDSYDGAFQKLGVDGGGHKIELKADGYEPLEFEVLITPGETVTYKGEMKRIK